MCSHTSSRNQRSCVTTRRAPCPCCQRCLRWRASHVIAPMSRWFVGSSIRITSHVPTSTRARSQRRRCPPESSPTLACQSTSPRSSSTTERTLGSDAHTYSGTSPTTACSTVSASSSASSWASMPTSMLLRYVTLPESGSRRFATSSRSVDLPSPFLPTMPMRSPSFMPMVWSRSTCLPGHSMLRCSQPIRIPKAIPPRPPQARAEARSRACIPQGRSASRVSSAGRASWGS